MTITGGIRAGVVDVHAGRSRVHIEFKMGVQNWRGGRSLRFRHLSPSIVPKRNQLTVYLTVKPLQADRKSRSVRGFYVPDTIVWE